MRLESKPQAFEDLQYWVTYHPKTAKRVLIPFSQLPWSNDRFLGLYVVSKAEF